MSSRKLGATVIDISLARRNINWDVVAEWGEDYAGLPDPEVHTHIEYDVQEALSEARAHWAEAGKNLPDELADGIATALRARLWAEVEKTRERRRDLKLTV